MNCRGRTGGRLGYCTARAAQECPIGNCSNVCLANGDKDVRLGGKKNGKTRSRFIDTVQVSKPLFTIICFSKLNFQTEFPKKILIGLSTPSVADEKQTYAYVNYLPFCVVFDDIKGSLFENTVNKYKMTHISPSFKFFDRQAIRPEDGVICYSRNVRSKEKTLISQTFQTSRYLSATIRHFQITFTHSPTVRSSKLTHSQLPIKSLITI